MAVRGNQEANFLNDYYQFVVNQKIMTDKDHEKELIETQK